MHYLIYTNARSDYCKANFFSSILFSLLVNDIETFFLDNSANGFYIDPLIIYLLVLSVPIAETVKELQREIDCFEFYLNNANVDKTKTVVFSKSKQRPNFNFTYGIENIGIVDSFNYLG